MSLYDAPSSMLMSTLWGGAGGGGREGEIFLRETGRGQYLTSMRWKASQYDTDLGQVGTHVWAKLDLFEGREVERKRLVVDT